MFGLVRSSTRPSWSLPARFSAARVERWHRTTSLTTIGLMFAHAFLFFAELSNHPRSYLVLHLGPLLPRHPQLAGSVLPTSQAATRVWLDIYRR
ncbi:MAG TPA: hypothetical protein VHH15_01275, partial [Actinophytocola sp.]|nr:hypothetical protein [Actinophytocola sp.]